jgi:hypothetical protein
MLFPLRKGRDRFPSLVILRWYTLHSYSCWACYFRYCDETALTLLALFAGFFDDRHVVGLDVHRSNGPDILDTDATNLLCKKRGNLADQNLFAVFGTPDKMVGQLLRDMFGVLRIHTQA